MAALISVITSWSSSPIYQHNSVEMEIARRPLSIRAVDISLKERPNFCTLNEENFSDLWEARYLAETHLKQAGYRNRLCYAQLEANASPVWQVTTYSNLPSYLDNCVMRKIYSIWQQVKVLFRTIFPPCEKSKVPFKEERNFWSSFDTVVNASDPQKSGRGALTQEAVIRKQILFPESAPSSDHEILLLYNYAPLRTGGEQMHFLLIPQPIKPAKNFLELDKEQYINALALAQKVTLWAQKTYAEQVTVHFFDKTGEIAGQTQPLFHAHLIIVKKGSEEIWGKIAMFLRMIFPVRPLPSNELESRVNHYRSSLGIFLAQ